MVARCLQVGCPFAGRLPECKVATRPGMPIPLGRLSVQELRDRRAEFNSVVLSSLTSSQWSDDLVEETAKDVVAGAMHGPWRLEDINIENKLLSRRMPVREERATGWKTRVVDDCSQSGINLATQATEKLSNDGIDVLVLMTRGLAQGGAIRGNGNATLSQRFGSCLYR